ncbi:hypothetical protein AAUPMB_03193, partial [Pasteurella multocida subsp. multocida str. Anand1_buffalo]
MPEIDRTLTSAQVAVDFANRLQKNSKKLKNGRNNKALMLIAYTMRICQNITWRWIA